MATKVEVKGQGPGEAAGSQQVGAEKPGIAEVIELKPKAVHKAPALVTSEEFKAMLAALDTERTALAKSALDQLKPGGKPFDSAIVRQINKLDLKKNRLLTSRFAMMLKKNVPGIQPIVHQIMEI